ncbi:DUF6286 domain-containing protein [Saccharothrix sp. BKS2]|uniref:DUF6286 domain-containing protein n=1 Tax=Saccharothrix sp. BKS2 TaxID=3064400 RepID=UPI0039EA0C9A
MRVLLRVLSPPLGLALAAAGLLLVAEVVWRWAGRGPLTGVSLAGWAWTDRPVALVGAGVAAGGLVLLVLALTARSSEVPLDEPAAGVRVVTTPTSLARVVGHRVRAEEGVSGASVTASRRRVRVRVTSRVHDEASLRPRLLEVARSAVEELPMPVRPKVSVVVLSPKDRAARPLVPGEVR